MSPDETQVFISTGYFPPKTYGPGEQVTGKVNIFNSKPELIGAIEIKLWGGIRTEITRGDSRNQTTYTSHHLMFVKQSTINAHSTPLDGGRDYSWPFAISFPTLMPKRSGPTLHHVDDTLPPTFTHHQYGSGAFVEYKLTASIYKHESHLSIRLLVCAGIEHLPRHPESTCPCLPQVHLESLTIELKAHDRFEADGAAHDAYDRTAATLWRHDWNNEGLFTKGEGWTKMLSATIPEYIPPAFETYKVKRSYFLHLSATVTVADKKFLYQAKSGSFTAIAVTVLPRFQSPQHQVSSGAQAGASSSNRTSTDIAEGEGMPTYQQALVEVERVAPPQCCE
ncbi:hypothetical protein NA57DRAFT_76564 [Rhizodiscina lignyota]|uniref:Arrestin-like N-terminal domain-containing protein n=1 Tax=Rhizodiscina lignyota TaxID=1504668 RepID=A0A9P4IEG0_9PEZI|nr:hypothetical protein NA57DRAFT_76564 [Rhizodiscina lignyota]